MSDLLESRVPLRRAVRRALRRLVPFLVLAYVVSFLDRANVAFAKEALAASRGISEHVYALGAGVFFLSYSTCGFPSNLILHRIGARRWISTLLIVWGLVSASTILVNGPTSFYMLRLLLGVTEAGFFPGIILYITLWFPGRMRGHIMGLFYLGVPLALTIGGPLSGLLLDVRRGLLGWQWMFLVEGLLAVVVGMLAFGLLVDCPANADWLAEDEKGALIDELGREQAERRATGPVEIRSIFRNFHVLRFVLIYMLIQVGTYGVVFYLPAEVGGLLHRSAGLVVGLVSAVPWIVAMAAVLVLPRAADARRNHRLMACVILMIAGAASFLFPGASPVVGLIALSVAAAGYIAVQPIFWTLPTSYLADRAAAGGIALIGAGNLGGFIAPNLKVWADDLFQSPHAGFYLLAALTVVNAGLIATVRPGGQHQGRPSQ